MFPRCGRTGGGEFGISKLDDVTNLKHRGHGGTQGKDLLPVLLCVPVFMTFCLRSIFQKFGVKHIFSDFKSNDKTTNWENTECSKK